MADRCLFVVALVLLVLAPALVSGFWLNSILTQALILGIGAASLIFLSAYGGMISLAQTGLMGIAGYALANMVTQNVPGGETKGLLLGWDPTLALIAAILLTVGIGLLFGAVASRSFGIYFLMLTLTYAVIGYYVFGQVTTLSGFGGVTGISPPSVFDGPVRLYYVGLVLSVGAYLGFRLIRRAPFGVALEGVRDDPIRMASLGFHVPLHRTLAFALAALVAAMAGIVNVWWNGQIDPNTISIGATIDLLVIAVIGGIARLEGAWLGALVFVMANNYLRDLPFADRLGLSEARFNTVVGLLVLAIVVLSPDGLMGIILRARDRSRGSPADRARQSSAPPGPSDGEVLANTP